MLAHAQCGTTPIAGDLIISSNTTLSGTYNISGTFRVDPGVVVTVAPYSSGGCGELIINAENIDVQGDIIADGAGFPGGAGGGGGASGNNVGALNGCVDKDNCLVIDVAGGAAGAPGGGPGAGAAGNGGSIGIGPKQECQNFGDEYGFVAGAGGAGGAGGGSYGGTAAQGGAGGNGAPYNSGNFSGMGIAGCASPQAGNGGTGGVVGGTYGTATGTDIDLGSGGAGAGGGGKSAANGSPGGTGGAGGGLIVLNANSNCTVAGTVSANGQASGAGGAGGNGGTTTDCCSDACNDCPERTFSSGAGGGAGGGGGSGGGIYIEASGVLTVTGTLRSSGGNGGAGGAAGSGTGGCSYSNFFCGSNSGSANAGSPGSQGGGGSGGRIKIFRNPCQSNTISPSVQIDGGTGANGQAGDGTYHLGDLGNIILPTVTTDQDSVSCFGLSDGSASVTVSGGTAPFIYLWTPGGATTPSVTGLEAGSYSVAVVDSFGCEVVQTVDVLQPDTLTAQIFGAIAPDCFGAPSGEVSAMGMGGTEPYTYAWNDPGLQTSSTATGLSAGEYVVEVTDANGCLASDTVELSNPQPFAASVSVDQSVSCFGANDGQATVTSSGSGLTYLWNDPLGQTTATASNLPGGSWNVTVSSSLTCDTTLTVNIVEPDSLILIAVQNQQVSCNEGSDGVALVGELGGTAPFVYQWDDPSLQTTDQATGLAAGTYNVVVTDANLCAAQATVEITEPSAVTIAVNITQPNCNGASDGEIEAIASGGTPGFTYEWSPGSISGNPLTGVSAGTYSVVATDANGCEGELLNILVQEPSAIVLSLVGQQNISCYGANDGQAEISATGGAAPYTYLWDDASSQSTALAGGLAPGVYNAVVTDANGCTAQWLNVNITEPDSLGVEIVSTIPITCDYSSDGVAEAQVSGGTIPYDYSWNDVNNQTGSTAIDLTAGTYELIVTDANGCQATASATIGAPLTLLNADFTLTPQTGDQPVEVTLTNLSSGGTAYEWIFGDGNTLTVYDTTEIQYLFADSGSFNVTLIAYNDITGCTDTLTINDALYATPTSELSVPNVITPNGDGFNDMFPIDPVGSDFYPFLIRNVYDFEGVIYNRWGEKVFEWTQPLGGWVGRSTSGLELPEGTYFYTITAKGVDDDKVTDYELKGSVTLIR